MKNNKQTFEISTEDYSPISEVTTKTLSPLLFSLSLIFVADQSSEESPGNALALLKNSLSSYSKKYLFGIPTEASIHDVATTAIMIQSSGKNNLKKRISPDGLKITLDLTVFVGVVK